MSEARAFRGLRHAVTMFAVALSSLLLLIYVGQGEARRNYFRFVIDGVVPQGRVIQNAMEGYLRTGLPLRQFVGFTTLAKPIADADNNIAAIFAVDHDDKPVFSSGDAIAPLLPPSTSVSPGRPDEVDIRGSDRMYQVVLPLRDKFEQVGSLVLIVPREVVSARVEQAFAPLLLVALLLSFGFAFYASLRGAGTEARRVSALSIGYGLSFVAMAGIVVATLISIYSVGVQAKTRALADSLAHRLSDLIAFNLNIDQVDGLDKVFDQYRKLNPDISAAALNVNGVIRIHTNPQLVGKAWVSDGSSYEYVVDLSHRERTLLRVEIAVSLPAAIVYDQVLRTAKNFAALFVASAFLAWLLLQLAGVLQHIQRGAHREAADPPSGERGKAALDLVRPIFFVAVFLEHLAYPFLPQYILGVTQAAGLASGWVSAPFIAYYVCFALALIPAGHFAERYGARRLMSVGLALAAAGLLGLALASEFGSVLALRAAAGIGQGMLFIGVQSYILDVSPPERRTRGAAIIVIGFQGGMISGTAIGSLLVGYIGMGSIFLLAGGLAAALAIYALALVPNVAWRRAAAARGGFSAWRQLGRDLGRVLPSGEFMRTMLLIGVPTKAVMTGVVLFALPLILSRLDYAPENIGQMIMIYAIGVLLASAHSARLVDRTGGAETALFWGAVASGAGLLLIGLIEWQPVVAWAHGPTLLLVAGVLVIGVAHGFVYAPVVTRIADCRVAAAIGANSVIATYRFLERLGHVAGPIIVGQLLLFADFSAAVFAWIGGAVVLLALIYLVNLQPASPRRVEGASPHGS